MSQLKAGSEIDHLVREMERVDDALAAHLQELSHDSASAASRDSLPPLEFARTQIKAWCAAGRGRYDAEVLASTAMAVDTMTREELVLLLRALLQHSKPVRRRPAA